MRYVKKMPTTDKELSNKLIKDGWTKLKEPKNLIMATLLSIPFMIINAGITMWIMIYLYPPIKEIVTLQQGFSISFTINLFTLIYFICILIFMIIHEFLHALFIPNFIKSDKTCWGINGLFGFVFTTEKIRKGRFLIISIMPFLLLSLILPFVLNLFGLLNGYTVLLCIINALGSCVDVLSFLLVLFQVPNEADIINNGFETFFKKK